MLVSIRIDNGGRSAADALFQQAGLHMQAGLLHEDLLEATMPGFTNSTGKAARCVD